MRRYATELEQRIVRALPTLLWILYEAVRNQIVEVPRDLRDNRTGGWCLFTQHGGNELGGVGRLEGSAPGEHLEHQRTEREQVAHRVRWLTH